MANPGLTHTTLPVRRSIEVLQECIDLQVRKGSDYQSAVSDIKQADYYQHGVWTLYDTMHAKLLRIKSVLMKIENGHGSNFESVQDSAKDLINYCSFMCSYLDGKMDGQQENRDIFNKVRT